jgi:hypothetical protein
VGELGGGVAHLPHQALAQLSSRTGAAIAEMPRSKKLSLSA